MGYARLLISGSFIRSSPLNLRLCIYFLALVGVFTLGNALFFGVAYSLFISGNIVPATGITATGTGRGAGIPFYLSLMC